MKFGFRKPNYKKRIKARTTGKAKRKLKKSVNPFYGKKGMGWVNNPKKAAYNKVYNKTTIGCALPLLLLGTLFLSACGIIDQSIADNSETAREEVAEENELPTRVSNTEAQTKKNGPLKVTLSEAEITQMSPEETLARDLVKLSVFTEIVNESENSNTIHPNQAIIQTNTGQEVRADQSLSDKVGGDFSPEQIKKGEMFFIFSGNVEDVSTIRCTINTGYDAQYIWLGEDLNFEFEF